MSAYSMLRQTRPKLHLSINAAEGSGSEILVPYAASWTNLNKTRSQQHICKKCERNDCINKYEHLKHIAYRGLIYLESTTS